jgi:hypothetical protein
VSWRGWANSGRASEIGIAIGGAPDSSG